ncbi:hypothetical protein FF1_018463 [Malus domestica]|uniref:abscisic acid 8'-hydroxylase 4-like n=1 Tax=Malus sylvestris TaxID=3752 RepID=UPI0021AC7FAE|nr:abscisic acid 8'-hydroxylase 4-like [Malus sylvestris]
MATFEIFSKMLNPSREELLLFVKNYSDILIAALLSIVTVLLVPKIARGRVTSSKGSIPGGLGLPIFGETLSFLSTSNSAKGCYDFVRRRRMLYGDWFKTRLFGKIHVYVPSSEGARTIFASDFATFDKAYLKPMSDAVGVDSLLVVAQETHRRIRRLLSDPFSMSSLPTFIQKLDKILCQELKTREESGEKFSVLALSMKLTSDAMCTLLMSVTDDKILRMFEHDCALVSDAMISFPVMIPGTRYYNGMKARARVMKVFKDMIAERRSGKEYSDDFLQSMIERDTCPDNEKLTDAEIMDNLLTLIIAGQTTTSAAMMWSLKFLDENREVLDRLREEQLTIARARPEGASAKHEDIKNMPYCVKVMKETLRLANVLVWFPRVATSDCTLEGFEIKKGWRVNIDVTRIHMNPDLFPNPTQFDPSRFDEMPKPYSYIPFGSGPRSCLGTNMAKATIMIFLHRVVSGYSWTIHDWDPSLEKMSHIPRLSSGLPITLKAL